MEIINNFECIWSNFTTLYLNFKVYSSIFSYSLIFAGSLLLLILIVMIIGIVKNNQTLEIIHICSIIDTNAILIISIGIIINNIYLQKFTINICLKLILLIIFNAISNILITSLISSKKISKENIKKIQI